MIQRFKALWVFCSILSLSLYCRTVLALDQTVNAATGAAAPMPAPVPTPTPTPAPVPAPPQLPAPNANIGSFVPPEFANKQVMEGIFVMIGSMLLMFGLAWLVLTLMGRIFGKKLIIKKPLILSAVGIVLIAIGRHVIK